MAAALASLDPGIGGLVLSELIARARRSLRRRLLVALGESATAVHPDQIKSEDLRRIKERFPAPKFFILGYPRSGTTLLARLLRLHPSVHVQWQAHLSTGEDDLISALLNRDLKRWLDRPSNRWVGEEGLEPALVRLNADFLMERALEGVGKRLVGDKTPSARCDLTIRRLQLIYPDARIIMIVRDGRDALLSQRFQAFVDQPRTLKLGQLRQRNAIRRQPDRYGAGGRSVFDRPWLQRTTGDWVRSVVEGHAIGERLYGGAYQALRYEDLLDQPLEQLSRLWRFLETTPDPDGIERAVQAEMARNPAADWRQRVEPELTRGLARGGAGGWRSWFTAADLELLGASASHALHQWGYPAR